MGGFFYISYIFITQLFFVMRKKDGSAFAKPSDLKTKTSKNIYHCSFLEKYMMMASAINNPMLPISNE